MQDEQGAHNEIRGSDRKLNNRSDGIEIQLQLGKVEKSCRDTRFN